MKNHNTPASCLRMEPTAAFDNGAGLSNIYCWGRTGSQSCGEALSSARVWNTRLQTWGRKTCKKMSWICRGLDKMANILHAIFSKALSWQKFNIFWLKYQLNLSLRVYLITNHQWLRQLFGAEPVKSRYLNQWWPLIWWMASAPGNILYNEFENYRHISQGPIG